MKTFEWIIIVTQLLGFPFSMPADVSFESTRKENPYVRMVEAIQYARCAEVKSVSLRRQGDTLIVDAFRGYYEPGIRYPYMLLYVREDLSGAGTGASTRRSPALASPALADPALLARGFTDAQEMRIPVPEAGRYYLLINDVNRSMLEVVVGTRRSLAPALGGELRTGCLVYE